MAAQPALNVVEPDVREDATPVNAPRVADLARQRWSRRKAMVNAGVAGVLLLSLGGGVWWLKSNGLSGLLPLPRMEEPGPEPASASRRGKHAGLPAPAPASAPAASTAAAASPPPAAASKPTVPAPESDDISPICIKGQPCDQRAGDRAGSRQRPQMPRDPRDAPMMVISQLDGMLVRVADTRLAQADPAAAQRAAERARLLQRIEENQRQLDEALARMNAPQDAPAQPATAQPAAPQPAQGQAQPREALAEALQLPDNSLVMPPRSIECSMLMKIATAMPGDFRCMVKRDVKGADGQITLIDRGSTIYGRYDASSVRIGTTAVPINELWLLTPAPYSVRVRLDTALAAGPLGEGGVSGHVDNRWRERIGPAIFLTVFSDASRALIQGRDNTAGNTVVIGNGALTTGDRLAQEALRQTINIPSILTKNQGDTVFIETQQPISFRGVYQLRAMRRQE
jgi:type IV secretion system protein VirB10